MLPLLVLAFIAVPIVELIVVLQVGSYLGVWPTVVILVADSLVGAVLVRREGRRAWTAFRRALESGRWPGDEVVQGALVLVGGALLLTPGFVTDAVGLLAVAPPSRAVASRLIRRRIARGRGRRRGGPPPGPRVEVVSVERTSPSGPSRDDPPVPGTDGGRAP